jgi:hypothetical protein
MDATLHDQTAGRLGVAVDTGHDQATAKVVCAWCRKTIRDGSEPVTHGICEGCYVAVKADSPSLATHIEGPCVQCQESTEAVVLYDGKRAFLCVPCQQKVRAA